MLSLSINLRIFPQVSYLSADHLGSPRVTTDGRGAVIARHDYMAFGSDITETLGNLGGRTTAQGFNSADDVRKQYTGYEHDDESGLDYAQARYYNSSHGRFTSVDPLTASASIRDPQTFNRYSYVLNSPYKFTDPLGLISSSTGACGGWCRNSDGGGGGLVSPYQAFENSGTDAAITPGTIARRRQKEGAGPVANSTTPPPTTQGSSSAQGEPANTQSAEQSASDTVESPTTSKPVFVKTNLTKVIVAYGQPGTRSINAGENFARAAATMQSDLEKIGYKVINVGEIGSTYGFQNLLDTAAKNKAVYIFLFTHGATTALDIGDGPRSDTKDVTTNNVRKFSNSSRSLRNIVIFGCNVGASDNGIGQALSNQLKVNVYGSTTGMSFSARPDRLTNGQSNHPRTGPTYMVPEGNGVFRRFSPQ